MRWPAGSGCALPPMACTMCGARRIPPLAMAEYAVAIWIGVTDSPWPMGRLPIDDPEYCEGLSTIPSAPREVDPGGGAEAEAVAPNSRIACWPSRMPIRSAPMLLDRFRMPAVVRVS